MSTLLLTLKWRMFAQEFRNVFYFAGDDAVQGNAQDLGDFMRARIAARIGSTLVNDIVLYGFDVKDLADPGNPTIEYTFTSGTLTGTSTNDPLPSQVAALVTFIALAAKPNRKRFYIPGFSEGNIGPDGRWTPGTLNVMGLLADDINIVGTTLSLAIAHVISRINRPTGVLVGSNILETKRLSEVPATQRRRRIGVGI